MRGFTLLETLFVLFIVSLLFGLAAPRFVANLDRYEMASQRKDIVDQFRQLPRRARLLARAVELPAELATADLGDGLPPLTLPPGWRVEFSPPLIVSSLGACGASTLWLVPDAEPEMGVRYRVIEPSCELQELAS